MKRDNTILWILGLALLLGGGGYAVYEMTRGIRNNNPGNIVYDPNNQWLGQTGSDGTFAIFSSPIYGIRALVHTLVNYVNKDGVTPTVNSIIRRWSKTDKDAYVQYVSDYLGVKPDDTIDVEAQAPQLVAAITHQENGMQPYDAATINQGVTLGLSS